MSTTYQPAALSLPARARKPSRNHLVPARPVCVSSDHIPGYMSRYVEEERAWRLAIRRP